MPTRCRRLSTIRTVRPAPLFGDAAAAVLLEPNTEGYGLIDSILRSDGSGELRALHEGRRFALPGFDRDGAEQLAHDQWDGHAVFKAAVSKMSDVSVEMMERHHLMGEDIRFLVPHQANLRIIDATARRMGITQDKCMINIDRNGNTTAATIPTCLYDYEKGARKGDNPDSLGLRRWIHLGCYLREVGPTTARRHSSETEGGVTR